jgi:hypothetical protein
MFSGKGIFPFLFFIQRLLNPLKFNVMQLLDNVRPLSEKILKSIPPLKDGEVAIFRLKNAFQKESGREEPSTPEIWQLPGNLIINDPYDEQSKTKTIGTFITDYRPTGSAGQVRPVYKPLIFEKGELKITSDRQAEYIFAMAHIDNESNRYRKQMGAKKAPKFFLVNSKQNNSFLQLSDMKYQAEKMVRESSFQYLREVAATLNLSPDANLHVKSFVNGSTINSEAMKYEMIQLAQRFPKQVMAAHPEPKIKLRVQIYDAQVFGVLMFEKGAYHLDTNKDFIELHKPDEDKDKIDSLVEYFMSETGKTHYLDFAKALKTALNANKLAA